MTIDRANRRLWIAPTVLSTLPNVRSLRALSGSRAIEFIAKLRTGADEFDDAATAQILQDLTLHELHQTNSQGIPMAPDLIFVQLASDIKNLAGQCSALANLGIATEVNRSVRDIEALPTLRDRLDGRLRAVLPLKSHLHVWQGSETAIFAGKWREISCLPDAGEHFVKTKVGYSTRYFWWAAGEDRLSPVDWSLGRWAYASIQAPRLLVLHRPESRQLLVVDGIPLPREIARALVGRTGTLPRSTTVHPTRATTTSRPTAFNVFENISIPFAEAVAAALGQPSGPQMRTNMEIHFD